MPTPLEWPLRDPVEATGTAAGAATATAEATAGQNAASSVTVVATATGSATRVTLADGTAEGVGSGLLRNYTTYQFYFDAYDQFDFESLNTGTGYYILRPAEERERMPFPALFPALDAIRRHMLSVSTSGEIFEEKARSVTVLAFSTELKSVFDDIFEITSDELAVTRPTRVKVTDIDKTLAVPYTYLNQAWRELALLKVPDAYLVLLNPRLYSASYADRVSGMCAIVLLAAVLIQEAGATW